MSGVVLNLSDTGLAGTVLVLGGARSGKSRLAEACLTALPGPRLYVATGRAWDEEMRARIAQHKAERAHAGWQTVEEPLDVPGVLEHHAHTPALLDCLTLWLTNLLLEERDVEAESARLLQSLSARLAPTVLVGNEVGLGIVPDNALARRFRDEAGRLHQRLAAQAARVVFVVAGLPMILKDQKPA
jgi:adenosylcobinamide kinase/adenosylcobinamide-phosphate guanylyltransferase